MRVRRDGMWQKVVAFHKAHPYATDTDIAAALDCPDSYVRATAKRKNLHLPSRSTGRVRHMLMGIQTWEGLRHHADSRQVSVTHLAERILSVVVSDNMIDAVLDDEVTAA